MCVCVYGRHPEDSLPPCHGCSIFRGLLSASGIRLYTGGSNKRTHFLLQSLLWVSSMKCRAGIGFLSCVEVFAAGETFPSYLRRAPFTPGMISEDVALQLWGPPRCRNFNHQVSKVLTLSTCNLRSCVIVHSSTIAPFFFSSLIKPGNLLQCVSVVHPH